MKDMSRTSSSSSSNTGMNSRKRKIREDDQLDEDLYQETKKLQIKVDDVWTSSSEGFRINQDDSEEFSKGDSVDSDLETEEVFDAIKLKDSSEPDYDSNVLSSEDVLSLEDEADKENGRTPIGKETPGASNWKESQCEKNLPQPHPDWLLTPPSLSNRNKECNFFTSGSRFSSHQASPLPTGLGWADPTEVWDLMVNKDQMWSTMRDSDLFSKHPSLEPRMRAILLDWLIEVCEVYKLHRETYYLAQDFIDRFLSSQKDVPKQQLQLIGITCLFIAAKVEEIYPPKICEFAYVTDGACNENEILDEELIILKMLNWDLSPVTVNSWLTIYLQLYGHDSGLGTKEEFEEEERHVEVFTDDIIEEQSVTAQRPECFTQTRRRRKRARRRGMITGGPSVLLKPPPGSTFVFPQFPGIALARVAHLADFATLDAQSLRFPYSVIAASTLYHVWSKEVALTVSGHSWADLKPCVEWMSAFAVTLKESGATSQLESQMKSVWARLGLGMNAGESGNRGSALLRTIPHLVVDDSHNIQTHMVDLDLLEKAQEKLSRMFPELPTTPPLVLSSSSSSPTSTRETELSSPATSLALLTPPTSSMKSSSASSSHGNIPVTPSTHANANNC